MDDEQRTIFEIPEVNLAKFEAECAKLSRKAERIGCDPITPFIFGHHTETLSDGHEHRVYEVLFTVSAPKIDGWTFLASIDHSQETGNIIRTVPNTSITLPASYRTAAPHCDHCKVRRYRRDTYVLHCEETGEFKQVGKSCLKDFFGHDPYKIAKMAELLGYAMECARGYEQIVGADLRTISVREFTAHVAWAIRNFGWVSRKAARENPYLEATVNVAWRNFHPVTTHEIAAAEKPTEEDKALAEAAMAWADSLMEKEPKTEYEHNICVIAAAQFVEHRSLGLLASIVGSYARNVQREIERRARREARRDSQHIGRTGERVRNLKATVIGYFRRETDFGVTHIYRFQTEEGDVIVWFASRYQSINEGDKVCLTGTVQKHEEFRGVKNTVMNRCIVTLCDEKAKAA